MAGKESNIPGRKERKQMKGACNKFEKQALEHTVQSVWVPSIVQYAYFQLRRQALPDVRQFFIFFLDSIYMYGYSIQKNKIESINIPWVKL